MDLEPESSAITQPSIDPLERLEANPTIQHQAAVLSLQPTTLLTQLRIALRESLHPDPHNLVEPAKPMDLQSPRFTIQLNSLLQVTREVSPRSNDQLRQC